MSFLILNKQSSAPSTPAANKANLYIDNTTKPILKFVDENANNYQIIDANFLTTKGSLITATAASAPAIISVGADGKVLAASSAASSGLAWVDPVVNDASSATVSSAYASDTYLAGSALTIPTAGNWRAGTTCEWIFDMAKTAAGTATSIITIRMGTLGTTGDASVMTLTFAAGTAAIDTGLFTVYGVFRTVGSGTSAVIQGIATCDHHLAATGLTSTGAAGKAIIIGTSSGFNSTTQTKIGLSFNGGTSFVGTNTLVTAQAINVNI